MGLRDLSEWDEDYILGLPTDEFDWIEYKASQKFADPAWLQDMSKYVSAWGNYDGGYIVFGVKDPGGRPSAIEIDGGVSVAIKPKLGDWLDEVLPRLVEPPLQRITTKLIYPKAHGSKILPGHAVIAVNIPESELAPHQALDRKYYQRLGRKLNPLKHRAIQDITSRRRHAKIRTTIRIHSTGFSEPSMFWKVENVGRVLALHWKVVIRFPTEINGQGILFKEEKCVIGETDDGKSFLELRIPQMMGSPLFPGSDVSRSFELAVVNYEEQLKPSIEAIRVTTFADDMPAFEETIDLNEATQHSKRLRAGL